MKAIETRFNGHRFRSRLEARWALFYSILKIPYRYEHEGFDLDNGIYYLPDFWLPEQDVWIEIKGCQPTDIEVEKAFRLSEFTKKRVLTFWGDIVPPHRDDEQRGESASLNGGLDYSYWWCLCPRCGKPGIEFEGRCERIQCGCPYDLTLPSNPDHPRLLAAYMAARESRFEHGKAVHGCD